MMAAGGRPAPVTISDAGVSKFVVDPNDANAVYAIWNDRIVRNHNGTSLGQWLNSSYLVSDFEVRATLVTGNTPTGTLGSWTNLAATQSWSLMQTFPGTKSCTLTIEIGYAGLHVALGTATVTIEATVDL
jgi:hypothetical protein